MARIRSSEPIPYKIMEINPVTHDTKSFKFNLNKDDALDFLPGDHLMMHAELNGQPEERPYTPASTPDDTGYFELIIKRYPDGLMSNYIHNKKVGEMVMLDGPTAGGHFDKGMADCIGLVAGGAGITPMISIIRTIILRGYDVDTNLLFANKTEQDIILRSEFEEYGQRHKNFKYVFALDEPPPGWTGPAGFIDTDLLKNHLPAPARSPLIFLCGPPMMEYKLREKILALGYDKSRLIIP
jgi:cytochrome-b5 reductase